MLLLCKTSRMTIVRVRRTLSKTEIERYTEVLDDMGPVNQPNGLVDEFRDTHHYVNGIKIERRGQFLERSNACLMRRGT